MTNTDLSFIKRSPRNHIHNKQKHIFIDQKLVRHQNAAYKCARNSHEDINYYDDKYL